MEIEEHAGERSLSRADLRRRKLIASARRLFIDNGFHATGIAQIARESGIAVGQIYRDFASKEDIVASIVEEDCSDLIGDGALQRAIDQGDRDRIETWLLGFVVSDRDIEKRRLFAEIVAESGRNSRIAAIFAALQDTLRANLLRAIDKIAPGDGLQADRTALADMVITFSLGLLHHQLMRPTLDFQPLERQLQAILMNQMRELRRKARADCPASAAGPS